MESYDRSSAKEYTTLKQDVTKKITGLRDEEATQFVTDDKHYKSLIAQVSVGILVIDDWTSFVLGNK